MSGSGAGAMLDVRDIRVAYPTPAGPRVVVDGLSLALVRGEVAPHTPEPTRHDALPS